jgi:4'-phosphopantetheinyl transferase
MTLAEIRGLSWESVRCAPALSSGELHLWKIPTAGRAAAAEASWPLLSAAERERAGRLRIALHRERYLRAQGGLRRILAHYVGERPGAIRFLRAAAGKPYLKDDPIHFNLTTSADLALVGVCLDQPVGVDCEQVRPRGEVEGVARRMFAPEVAERVSSAPHAARLEHFYIAWTALEADVKADGRGLFRHRADPLAATPRIGHCIPEPGFVAAVASPGLPPIARWRALILEDG